MSMVAAAAVVALAGGTVSVPEPPKAEPVVAGSVLERSLPAPPEVVAEPEDGEVAVVLPPEEFPEPPAPPAPPPPALEEPAPRARQGGTWAVIIGVNDYPGSRYDLRSAVADADDVDRALAAMGVARANRLVLRDRQVTGRTIRAAADWLVSHAGPDAVAVFFYAGHVRRLGGGREAMVAADGTLVTDADLAASLEPLAARRAWIALAACYSGGFTEVVRPGRVLTAAAPAHKLAYENEAYGRSYLVEYMVRRAWLQGQGPTTVEAAFAWAEQQLRRDHPNRVPVQVDHHPGELDLRPAAAAARPPPTTAPPAGTSSGEPAGEPSDDGSGGDDSGPAPPTPTTPPPPPGDNCQRFTLGVVRCGDG